MPIIAGEMSTPEDAPAGLDAGLEVGRDLARPGRDVEDPVARSERRLSLTARVRQRGSWNAEIARFIGS